MMSTEEQKRVISREIEYLRDCTDFKSVRAGEAFDKLCDIDIQKPSAAIVSNHIAEQNYGHLFVNMWTALSPCMREKGTKGYTNFKWMLGSYVNLTDTCPELATELGACGCISRLVEVIIVFRDFYSQYKSIIQSAILILSNCINKCNDNVRIYREANVVSALKKYLDCEDMDVRIRSLRILAFIVDEEECGILQTVNGGVVFLVEMIKDAAMATDHQTKRGNSISRVLDLLKGLNKLAVNDANKVEIERQGGLPIFIRMLREDFSEEEQLAAVEALWNLAFVESIRQSNELQASVKPLKKLMKSSNQQLREKCEYAIWQIQGRNRESLPTTPQESSTSYDEAISQPNQAKAGTAKLMISYQWANQKETIKIRDSLNKAGYKVWMDVTHMRHNILSAMADAVEKSDVILICMSEKYKNSQNCRAEAEYAYQLQKPIIPLLMESEYKPDGWLGILLGMKLYHKCNSADQLDMATLLNEIRGSMPSGSDTVHAAVEPITKSEQDEVGSTPSSQKQAQSTFSACDWTEEDVQAWLQKNKLPELCETLDFCDGDQIRELYNQHCRDPRTFKDEMVTEYKMSHKTHLKFVGALKKLFRN